ncbi:1,3-beta-glucan synthase subunit FKS1-like, domain-1 [Cynara cardunculus var. scolymus]|uniref:1,3-beta-glucan synthase subunit FKS1-like, domain-1 n=1 Tax=Cynara cardunculus var. scolymus TaxID=59895 RepID=A0A118JVI2_CYNCS|nr:1,3-beta-glucan synthase subunit FKS1-like, domain-1 [Cynara cardunculus var. scolymus]
MAEIVVAEPSIASTSSNTGGGYGSNSGTKPFYIRSITSGNDEYVPEPFDSEKLPVTLKSEIQRFLRVANLIDAQEPRVACRFHAFVVAHDLDRNSNGRGVRQFKTALLQRLEQDEEVTYRKRKEKSDVREVRRVYREYKDYIIKHGGESTLENRPMLITTLKEDPSSMIITFFPLITEIKAAVGAVRNVIGIPFVEEFSNHEPHFDLFDWLQHCFGFQIAFDLHSILMGDTILSTGDSFLPSYGRGPESFLVNMVTPIYDVIRKVLHPTTVCYSCAFLILAVEFLIFLIMLLKEAMKNQNGMTDHSTWRNYDDLNEFFWLSPDFKPT